MIYFTQDYKQIEVLTSISHKDLSEQLTECVSNGWDILGPVTTYIDEDELTRVVYMATVGLNLAK